MSLFLDGLILFCIAFCVIAGVKNGFVRSVMGICKGAVSLIVAYAYTPLIADRIRDSYLIGRIADGIAETLKSLAVNVEDRFAGGSVTYDLSKIAAELPEAYTSILTRYHIDIPSFTAEIAPVTSADEGMITSVAEQIAAQLDTRVFQSKIRGSVSVAESPAHGVSVLDYAPRSKPSLDFEALCEEIAGGFIPHGGRRTDGEVR